MQRIQDKITELSKKPSTNADTIAVLRMCQARIEQLEQDNSEKAAHVDRLCKAFNNLHDISASCDSWESFPQRALDEASLALDSTPAQCLAEVRAQAAKDAVNYVFDYIMADLDVEPVANEITLTPKDLNEYRSQFYLDMSTKSDSRLRGSDE